MTPTRQGSIHLFRFAGIDLYLHWSWFLVAVYGIQSRAGRYSTMLWPALEYVALFAIVLMHEFGHALACRQVGGQANQIVLWPLGGVAYVAPPLRPGAVLWSIAAGPLVNVLLAPVLTLLAVLGSASGWGETMPNGFRFITALCYINWGLLIFNMLPIYPLDGGQILQSLLWFVLGRARSLMVATVTGFIGVVGLIAFALWTRSAWIGVISLFLLMNCWGGLQQARALSKMAKLPRRDGYVCPTCGSAPPLGNFWRCRRCGQSFDTFQTQAVCPACGVRSDGTQCLDCRRSHPMSEWMASAMAAPQGYR